MAAAGASRAASAMRSERVARALLRLSVAGLSLTLLAYGALFAALAWPGPLFRHEAGGGVVTFHSEAPLPPAAGALGHAVTASLAVSPLGLPERGVDIWLVDEGWRVGLFFAGSRRAAGLTYPVVSTRNVFLRHADLAGNRMRRDGVAIPPPRTLEYYLVHEIAHLMVARRVGRLAIVRMPRWINEGFADYVALGPAPPGLIALFDAGHPLPARHWGSYAAERVCVTRALAQLSGDLDALFALTSDMPARRACPNPAVAAIPADGWGIAPAGGGT